jgi:uncharacterized membrane protein YtjA (UPF0391 family)
LFEILITSPVGNLPIGPCPKEDMTMLQLAITCLIIALIAGLFGFGVISSSFMGVAKILFVVFLILAVLSYFGGGFRRRI